MNLVRLLLALLAAVTLAITASALPENVTTGPYSVSFDMNATLNYTVESLDPVEEDDRTEYQLTINANDSTKAKIFIAEYKDLVDSTEEMWQTVNRQHLESIGLNNITLASEMVIDGMPAFGLVGKDIANTTLYSAYYWLDSNDLRVWSRFCREDSRRHYVCITAEHNGTIHGYAPYRKEYGSVWPIDIRTSKSLAEFNDLDYSLFCFYA